MPAHKHNGIHTIGEWEWLSYGNMVGGWRSMMTVVGCIACADNLLVSIWIKEMYDRIFGIDILYGEVGVSIVKGIVFKL
jgi:hypothetical protein